MTKRRFLNAESPPHLITLVCIAGLGGVSMNMFLPSLPGMANYFGVPNAVMQLSLSVYLAASAILQFIAGPLSDRFGRRPVMLVCSVVFFVGSLVCFLAPSFEMLLFGRILQANAVVGMVLSRAIVRDMFEPSQAASMLSYVTMGMAVGPMIAPALGGVLDEMFGWRASFAAMMIMGVFVFFLIISNLGETNKAEFTSFRDQMKQYPALITSGLFWGYSSTIMFTAGAFFAFIGGGPFIANDLFNLSPTDYGLYFMTISGGYMVGNFVSAKIAARVGLTRMMLSGAILTFTALFLGVITLQMGFIHPMAVFGPVIFVGFGNGLTLPSANTGLVSVNPKLAGSASGLGGALQIGGGALITAATGTLVSTFTSPSTLLVVMGGLAFCSILTSLYVGNYVRRQKSITA
ncbi:MAG: Bcr/CflA family drug resistance efflux transporter [Hyphomicrobiales bacterium]|nr:MAG: Bcr/CflA family drug resistance efflux transporter [Hyphomicrobiales bacterium]